MKASQNAPRRIFRRALPRSPLRNTQHEDGTAGKRVRGILHPHKLLIASAAGDGKVSVSCDLAVLRGVHLKSEVVYFDAVTGPLVPSVLISLTVTEPTAPASPCEVNGTVNSN